MLAVTRAGRSYFDPRPDFVILAGDRLVLLGERENLQHATDFIKKQDLAEDESQYDEFILESIEVHPDSPWVNKTIRGLNFRNEFGVTITGIRRGETQITAPAPGEVIKAGDILTIVGTQKAMKDLTSRQAGR